MGAAERRRPVAAPGRQLRHGSTGFRFAVSSLASSVWDTDGSVSLAIGMSNVSTAASAVRIDALSIATATRLEPATLPLALGSMPKESTRFVDTRFQVPAVGPQTRYTVRLSGRVSNSAGSCGFSLSSDFTPVPRTDEVFDSTAGTSELKDLISATFPPRIGAEFDSEEGELSPATLPIGPPRVMFAPTTTETTVAALPLPSIPPSGPPDEVLFFRNTPALSFTNGVKGDPSTSGAEAGGVALVTSNGAVRLVDPTTGREEAVSAFMGVSVDDGQTFTKIDLLNLTDPADASRKTLFPEVDGGLCCDQMVLFIPNQNLFVWVGLYTPRPTDRGNGGRLRVAFATPDDIRMDFLHAWRFFDITPADVTLGGGSLDFPDLAYSDRFLYVTAQRVIRGSGVTTGLKLAIRVPLEDLVNRVPQIRREAIRVNGPDVVASSRLVQSSPFSMVWAAPADTSTLSVFAWPDGAPQALRRDVKISQFRPVRTLAVPGKDGKPVDISQFSRIDGATATEETCEFCPRQQFLYFAFNAAPNTLARPVPFVRVEKIDLSRMTAASEVDVFNPTVPFFLPSLAAKPAPHSDRDIALSLGFFRGGFLDNAVGFLGDSQVFQTTQSTATPESYGDFFQVRPSVGPPTVNGRGIGFATLGYSVSAPGGGSSCARQCGISLLYVAFGRRRELFPDPPQLTVNKFLIPASDAGRFNLLVDGIARATGVGDGGTTGPVTLTAGTHRVSESAVAGTDLSRYGVEITGDCAPDGTVSLRPGDNQTCLIFNTAPSGCRADCKADRDFCMADSGRPGGPLPRQCASEYMACLRGCPQ